jgi:hypothetical protein
MNLLSAALLCGVALIGVVAEAQPDYALHATPLGATPVDPAIARALATIKPQQIEQTVKSLVSFGTRNTLSSMQTDLPPGEGINPAAEWVASQFDAISRQCGGCLEVKRDTFTADPASGARWARRIPKPTQITNVYAIQRGTDPAQAKRMVLVTGHYDSINSNVRKNWAILPALLQAPMTMPPVWLFHWSAPAL